MPTVTDESAGRYRTVLRLPEGTVLYHGYGRCPSPLLVVKSVPERNELWGKAALAKAIEDAGLPLQLIAFTYAIKFDPPAGRTPYPLEILASRPFLLAEAATIAPVVIVTLGETAFRCLTGDPEPFEALEGKWRPLGTARVLPLADPEDDLQAVRSGLGSILGG